MVVLRGWRHGVVNTVGSPARYVQSEDGYAALFHILASVEECPIDGLEKNRTLDTLYQ